MLKWLKRHQALKEMTPDHRECRNCAAVDILSNRIPMAYICTLDREPVHALGRCDAYADWSMAADEDLPTSAHEKAATLAVKQSTYVVRKFS